MHKMDNRPFVFRHAIMLSMTLFIATVAATFIWLAIGGFEFHYVSIMMTPVLAFMLITFTGRAIPAGTFDRPAWRRVILFAIARAIGIAFLIMINVLSGGDIVHEPWFIIVFSFVGHLVAMGCISIAPPDPIAFLRYQKSLRLTQNEKKDMKPEPGSIRV